MWVDQNGTELPAAVPFEAPFFSPHLSPEGKHTSYTTQGMKKQVFVYDLDRGTPSPLTEEGTVNFAVWTPDSKRVVFGWSTSVTRNIFARLVDQSAPAERLTKNESCLGQSPGSWSPDDNLLAFTEQVPDTLHDILFLDRRNGLITPFAKSRADEYDPEFSPDGRRTIRGMARHRPCIG